MTKRDTVFSAAAVAAGYLYQARLALAECLRFAYVDSTVEVAIERLDDVSFEREGSALELLQTKHHLNRKGDLTDASVDLWKTLRVWAEATKADPSIPSRTRLALITTATAPEGSAASLLRPSQDQTTLRNVGRAHELLLEAAATSENVALRKAFAAFTSLSPEMRTALLEAIEIVDNSAIITDLEEVIEGNLRMLAPRNKLPLAREQLEGWWWPRVCRILQGDDASTISIIELEQKLDDIRECLKRDALPIEMDDVEPEEHELSALSETRFVRQLQTIGVGATRLQLAKRDYYRAFTQRSRWTRRSLLFDGEVAKFERTLIEEWQPRFEHMRDSLDAVSAEAAIRKAGQNLYHWVEADARYPFRTTSNRFLSVGSYHMLADELRVGWHRDYAALLSDENEGGDDEQ